MWWESIQLFIQDNSALSMAGLMGSATIFLVWLLILTVQMRRWRGRYFRLMGNSEASVLEEKLIQYGQSTEQALADTAKLAIRCREIEQRQTGHLQRVGIVRFSAFPEVGGDLSFAIALLDGKGDGVVISSIYGREDTRVFAKPVTAGESSYRLSGEEEKAITAATIVLK